MSDHLANARQQVNEARSQLDQAASTPSTANASGAGPASFDPSVLFGVFGSLLGAFESILGHFGNLGGGTGN